ncbi:uncharacterized protein BKCO1_11000139 [Diplodia corticola]|uniref:Uncharacterized protein n=1 Tax=Diplodia corticola TaxID=236234 RepID=A0A1J9R7H9_9PEZI|nr:uncharacterized protein BKCO1_11000139 [Diplodia corticola]OJD36473.1 hypothetical protein BKCO1_11000139 [Diplodia corticola]
MPDRPQPLEPPQSLSRTFHEHPAQEQHRMPRATTTPPAASPGPREASARASLLGLPREVRNLVYEFVLYASRRPAVGNDYATARPLLLDALTYGPARVLLLVNRQIHAEYVEAVYRYCQLQGELGPEDSCELKLSTRGWPQHRALHQARLLQHLRNWEVQTDFTDVVGDPFMPRWVLYLGSLPLSQSLHLKQLNLEASLEKVLPQMPALRELTLRLVLPPYPRLQKFLTSGFDFARFLAYQPPLLAADSSSYSTHSSSPHGDDRGPPPQLLPPPRLRRLTKLITPDFSDDGAETYIDGTHVLELMERVDRVCQKTGRLQKASELVRDPNYWKFYQESLNAGKNWVMHNEHAISYAEARACAEQGYDRWVAKGKPMWHEAVNWVGD